MKSIIFWDITPCSPLSVNRRFGGTYRLYLQGRKISRARNQRERVLSTLVHRARALCDQDSLHAELVFLGDIFRQNGYTEQQIRRALPRGLASPTER
jgi:hypothetical protein